MRGLRWDLWHWRAGGGGDGSGRRAEEVEGQAVGAEGEIEGFADLEEDEAALEAAFRVLGKFGIYAVFDLLPGDGDFAFLARKVACFAQVADEVRAPGIFRRI